MEKNSIKNKKMFEGLSFFVEKSSRIFSLKERKEICDMIKTNSGKLLFSVTKSNKPNFYISKDWQRLIVEINEKELEQEDDQTKKDEEGDDKKLQSSQIKAPTQSSSKTPFTEMDFSWYLNSQIELAFELDIYVVTPQFLEASLDYGEVVAHEPFLIPTPPKRKPIFDVDFIIVNLNNTKVQTTEEDELTSSANEKKDDQIAITDEFYFDFPTTTNKARKKKIVQVEESVPITIPEEPEIPSIDLQPILDDLSTSIRSAFHDLQYHIKLYKEESTIPNITLINRIFLECPTQTYLKKTYGCLELHAVEMNQEIRWRIYVQITNWTYFEKKAKLLMNCICGKQHQTGFIISCFECGDLFHGSCVRKNLKNKHRTFICIRCLNKDLQGDTNVHKIEQKKIQETDLKQFIYIDTLYPEKVFSYLIQRMLNHFNFIEIKYENLKEPIGFTQSVSDNDSLPQSISSLVELLYSESSLEISGNLGISLASVQLHQVEKAEALLLFMKEILEGDYTPAYRKSKLTQLSNEFYSTLPFPKRGNLESILDSSLLQEKLDLIQLLHDSVSVNESISGKSDSLTKYKALQCEIDELSSESEEFAHISQLILNSKKPEDKFDITIQKIYSVKRKLENSSLMQTQNTQLLFHGSRVSNFLSILSRGILLPKRVRSLGGKRTDIGMLGSGIYFSNSISASIKYCHPSKKGNTRLVAMVEVNLGRIKETTEMDPSLTCAPEGYDSVHALNATSFRTSDFLDEEFVIYNTQQQEIRYLIEFSSDFKVNIPNSDSGFVSKTNIHDNQGNYVIPFDAKVAPKREEECGLVAGDNLIPLKAVHALAEIVDLIAQVTIFQEYINSSSTEIEAKYAFPTPETAAVCGFEVFIGDKHIVAKVKEKEQAQQEFKEAIQQGHGAYLLEEEEPNIFTMNVGTIPPHTTVIIKLKYVYELRMDGANIFFIFPSKMAPSQSQSAFNEIRQNKTETLNVTSISNVGFQLQISISSQDLIENITSPTHKFLSKKATNKATIQLVDSLMLKKDFILLIQTSNPHVPRMWIETNDDSGSQAAMVTFYPQFMSLENFTTEFIFLLDLSSSMKGQSLEDAKRYVLLALKHLPPDSTFHLISFGSRFEKMSIEPLPVNSETIQLTKNYLQLLDANLGGTDLFLALKPLYLTSDKSKPSRSIFLFTDGQLGEFKEHLQELVSSNIHRARLFLFGVSDNCNRYTISTLARLGAGFAEFLPSKQQSEAKVIAQIKRALQPAFHSISIEWDTPPLFQAPNKIFSLFSGQCQVIYAIFDSRVLQATLSAEYKNEKIVIEVRSDQSSSRKSTLLHILAARSRIRDWENGILASDLSSHELNKIKTKEEIIRLGLQYNLASSFTSFIAIEERIAGENQSTSTPSLAKLTSKESVDELLDFSWDIHSGGNLTEEEKEKQLEVIQMLQGKQNELKELLKERDYEIQQVQEEIEEKKEGEGAEANEFDKIDEDLLLELDQETYSASEESTDYSDMVPLKDAKKKKRKEESEEDMSFFFDDINLESKKKEKKPEKEEKSGKVKSAPVTSFIVPIPQTTATTSVKVWDFSPSAPAPKNEAKRSKREELKAKREAKLKSKTTIRNEISISPYDRYGGGLSRFLVEQGIKQLRIDDFISISSFGPMWVNQLVTKNIRNPWGFEAVPSAKSLQMRQIFYVFKGPENDPMAADCWFNAVLGFGLGFFHVLMPRIQRFLNIPSKKDTNLFNIQDGGFLNSLLQFYNHWSTFEDSLSPSWAQELVKLQKKLHPYFENNGFKFGKSHCALKATQLLISLLEKSEKSITLPSFIQTPLSISVYWKCFTINGSWDALFYSSSSPLGQKEFLGPEFLIYCNLDYSPFPIQHLHTLLGGEYQVSAWISFEELVFDVKKNDTVNHYTALMINHSEFNKIWMYDDLLHLKPGGYQGVQLCLNQHKTSKLFKKVPVVLFRKK